MQRVDSKKWMKATFLLSYVCLLDVTNTHATVHDLGNKKNLLLTDVNVMENLCASA